MFYILIYKVLIFKILMIFDEFFLLYQIKSSCTGFLDNTPMLSVEPLAVLFVMRNGYFSPLI